MNHKDMKNWDKAQIASEINAAETAFKKVLGQNGAPFFRFPFGHQNSKVEKYVEELGYRPVYWHIDTIDWREDPVSKIISRVSKKLKSGSVVLMHLGSKNGAKALPEILRIVLARGFLPARLSDLNMDQIASLP
jgi:peptidoglycan-N-acetylmuramic acid deacetylase